MARLPSKLQSCIFHHGDKVQMCAVDIDFHPVQIEIGQQLLSLFIYKKSEGRSEQIYLNKSTDSWIRVSAQPRKK